MDKCREALAGLKLDPSNPYMQCLAGLLEPPTNVYLAHLVTSYETLLPTLDGKKKDVAENIIADLKKKIISP
jgi:hypothetical protein